MDTLCFDVECDSLSGRVFAVGGVVLAPTGEQQDTFFFCLTPGTHDPCPWVEANVIPAVARRAGWAQNVSEYRRGDYPTMIRDFWAWWRTWKAKGVTAVVDCGCPAEGGFIRDVLAQVRQSNPADEFAGPYPLHDVATALHVQGHGDPKRVEFLRGHGVTVPEDYTEHDPVWDAWASAMCWNLVVS